mmetsp:Transcript_6400/g.5709  ORF Transcript_6400/g.5709 Transcript_6400/m.5709 type:complete len:216 (-) Transcript_6400:1761-2408(-)
MDLPHLTAVTMEAKLSSKRMMSEASLATSVPEIPMAKPTSAFLRAGASLVPSPVTATTLLFSLRPVTSMYLSSGVDLASTFNCFITVLKAALFPISSRMRPVLLWSSSFLRPPQISLNCFPSMQAYSFLSLGSKIPASRAMALAVSNWSPVTILMLIPANWHLSTDPTISFLRGSIKAKIAIMVMLDSKTVLSYSFEKLLLAAFNCSYSSIVMSE